MSFQSHIFSVYNPMHFLYIISYFLYIIPYIFCIYSHTFSTYLIPYILYIYAIPCSFNFKSHIFLIDNPTHFALCFLVGLGHGGVPRLAHSYHFLFAPSCALATSTRPCEAVATNCSRFPTAFLLPSSQFFHRAPTEQGSDSHISTA